MKLTADNIGERVGIVEAKQQMLDMLEKLADVCESNGLRYYLDGGTLIGAARHKGFIPWDDDIDVMMPKSDCLKLKQITGGRIGEYVLSDPMDKEYELSECWRLYDNKYIVKSDFNGTLKPLWIDIEPMVGFPDTKKEIRITFRKLKIYRMLLQCVAGNLWHGSTLFRKVVHLVLRPFVSLIGYNRIFNMLEKTKDQYAFDEKEYVGNMCSPVAQWRGMVRREDYIKPRQLEFEGRMYSVPGNYIDYLEPLYGKNCTTELPPIEKRVSHSGQIYQNKKVEEKIPY